jgi:hypothetical protein
MNPNYTEFKFPQVTTPIFFLGTPITSCSIPPPLKFHLHLSAPFLSFPLHLSTSSASLLKFEPDRAPHVFLSLPHIHLL